MKRCRECKPHLLKEKIGHHIFGIRRQAINLHDLTVLIEETGAYPTAVLCRIERFLADLQFAAARSLCRMYCGSKTILVTAIHAARISFSRQTVYQFVLIDVTVCRLKLSQHFFLQFDVGSYPLSDIPSVVPRTTRHIPDYFLPCGDFFIQCGRLAVPDQEHFFLCTESVLNFHQVSPDVGGVYKSENVHLYSPLYRYSIQRICRMPSCFFLA